MEWFVIILVLFSFHLINLSLCQTQKCGCSFEFVVIDYISKEELKIVQLKKNCEGER